MTRILINAILSIVFVGLLVLFILWAVSVYQLTT